MSKITEAQLCEMNTRELAQVMEQGHSIGLEDLNNSEYRGISLGLPAIVDKLLWKTFQKSFYRDEDGHLRGWNIRLEQDGFDAPMRPMQKKGKPLSFGHYKVLSSDVQKIPRSWKHALLLDYRNGGNTFFDIARFMGALLVAVNPDDPSLLLGWEFIQIGPFQIPTTAYWTLKRRGAVGFIAEIPK